jgi:hypothetical protein
MKMRLVLARKVLDLWLPQDVISAYRCGWRQVKGSTCALDAHRGFIINYKTVTLNGKGILIGHFLWRCLSA